MIAYGFIQNKEAKKRYDDYKAATSSYDDIWNDFENAKQRRNISFAVGGALLATGITFHFIF